MFPAGPQPRPSPPSVPCRTSTTTIHAQCSLPDLNREYPRQVFPAGPHVGRYGTKNVYILFDRLTCTMTCQVKQMIGIVSWAKVPWQKLQTKVVSTSCFEMSWWGSLEAKYFSYLWNGSFNDPTNHSYWIFIISREWLLIYYGITNPTFSTSKDSFTAGNWSHTDLPSESRHRAATKCATDFSHDLGPWEVIFRMCGTARRMCGFSFLILYDCHSHILVVHINSYYVILWLL